MTPTPSAREREEPKDLHEPHMGVAVAGAIAAGVFAGMAGHGLLHGKLLVWAASSLCCALFAGIAYSSYQYEIRRAARLNAEDRWYRVRSANLTATYAGGMVSAQEPNAPKHPTPKAEKQ